MQKKIIKKLLYIIFNIIIFVCILTYIDNSNKLETYSKIRIISVYYLLNFISSLYIYYINYKTLFDTFIMFYLVSFMFNGSKMFLISLGIKIKNDFLFNCVNENEVLHAFILVIITMTTLFNLFILFNNKKTNNENIVENMIIDKNTQKALRYTGYILYIISFIPTILSLKSSISLVMSGGYMAQYQQDLKIGIDGISSILVEFFIPGNLFIYAGSINFKKMRYLSSSSILLVSIIRLALGNRSSAIINILILLYMKNRLHKRVNMKLIILLFSIMMFIISPLIGSMRDYTNDERINIIESFKNEENLFVKSVNEMGSSVITVAYTYRLIPRVNQYEYGMTYLRSLSSIIPNLFWDIHPAVANKTPSQWLIWSVDPVTAKSGGGLGYSYIAEAYLNFGYLGCFIIPLIFAILFTFIKKQENKNNIVRITCISIYISYFLLITRNDSMYIFRSMIWYCILPYVIYIIILNFINKKELLRIYGERDYDFNYYGHI